jgi:hypothetical protein
LRAVADSRTLVARGRPGSDDAIDVDNVVELLPSGPVRARERPAGAKHFSDQQIDEMRNALEPTFPEPHVLSRHHLIA